MDESPVQLDLELCKACGICIAVCPEHVFDTAEMGEAVVARPDDCTMCLLCELHCPDFAIEVRRREQKSKEPAAGGAPALTQADLIAAASGGQSPDETCGHDGEV